MRRRRGRFECVVCGAELPVVSPRRVRRALVGGSGVRTQRVIFVNGREVHRCTVRGPIGSQHP